MPVLRHAKKKLKQDKKRTTQNRKIKEGFKVLIKKTIADKSAESLSHAFSSLDKAAKQNIIHKNKAARMKASLAKVVSATGAIASPAKAKVKAGNKTVSAKSSKSSGTKSKKSSPKKAK